MKVFAKVVHYAARTVAIIFAAFLSVFILEGFDPAFGWQSGVSHAIPAAVAITLGIAAHLHPKIGGWLYIGFAVFFLGLVMTTSPMARSGTAQFLQLFLNMSPLFLFISGIGALFLLDARFNKKETAK